MWVWLVVFLTPKRYHLKILNRNMLLVEPGFNLVPRAFQLKGKALGTRFARASRPDSKERRKSSLKTEMRAFSIVIFASAP